MDYWKKLYKGNNNETYTVFDLIPEADMSPGVFAVFVAASALILYTAVGYFSGTPYETVLIALGFVLGGFSVISHGYDALFRLSLLDPDLLASAGAILAFLCGSRFKSAVALLIYQIVRYLCSYLLTVSGSYFRETLLAKQQKIHWLLAGREIETESDRITAGMLLEIREGEEVPVEVKIIEGEAVIDTAAETFEAAAGTVLTPGNIIRSGTVKAEALRDCAVDNNARRSSFLSGFDPSSSATYSNALKTGRYLTLAMVVTAVLLAVILPLSWHYSLKEAGEICARILMVAAPASLILSAVLAMLVTVGLLAERGILVRNGQAMENISGFDVLVADSRGTLYTDDLSVESIQTEIDAAELLQIACALVKGQDDEVSQAILNSYSGETCRYEANDLVREEGLGVSGICNDRKYYLGNEKYIESAGYQEFARAEGRAVYLADEEKVLGQICFASNINEENYRIMKQLHDEGVNRIVILSSEPQAIAEKANAIVKADEVYGGLSTAEKQECYRKLADFGHRFCFIGDALIEETLLNSADVSVSWGRENQGYGLDYCDGVILSRSLQSFAQLRSRTKSTLRLLKILPIVAVIVKLALVIVAVMRLLDIEMIVAVDGLVSLICMALASRGFSERKRT